MFVIRCFAAQAGAWAPVDSVLSKYFDFGGDAGNYSCGRLPALLLVSSCLGYFHFWNELRLICWCAGTTCSLYCSIGGWCHCISVV